MFAVDNVAAAVTVAVVVAVEPEQITFVPPRSAVIASASIESAWLRAINVTMSGSTEFKENNCRARVLVVALPNSCIVIVTDVGVPIVTPSMSVDSVSAVVALARSA